MRKPICISYRMILIMLIVWLDVYKMKLERKEMALRDRAETQVAKLKAERKQQKQILK